MYMILSMQQIQYLCCFVSQFSYEAKRSQNQYMENSNLIRFSALCKADFHVPHILNHLIVKNSYIPQNTSDYIFQQGTRVSG
jgi:hypothetical protein